jgi:excisionase family DNA binding protein
MATRRVYETLQGQRIEFDEPDAKLARLLRRVEEAAASNKAREDELVALIYSDENPLLEPSPVGGAPLVTKGTLAHPVWRVLTDLLERARVRERGIDVDKLAAGYKLSVAEAAERLGVHESAIRQAVQAGRLPAWVKEGRIYLHPKWLEQFGATLAEKGKRGPKPLKRALLRYKVGSVPGASLRMKAPARITVPPGGTVEAELTEWRLVGVITSRRGDDGGKTQRFFVLEPEPGADNVIRCSDLWVRGAFRIASKENNSRKALEAWKAFEAE